MTKTNYFKGVSTLQELKAAYKKLASVFHPDNGGDLERMQELNAEYDQLFNTLKHKHNQEADEDHQMNETPEQYRDIIINIMNLEGIEIELCGSWLWVSGATREYKDIFKENGFYWASKKHMWYWRAEEFRSKSRKSQSMDKIRDKYGSQKIVVMPQTKLA